VSAHALDALLRSLVVALTGTAIATLVGVAIAAWLARRRGPFVSIVESLVIAPMVLPPTVLGFALLLVIGRTGVVGRAIERVFGAPIVFTITACVIAAFLAALPFVVRTARVAFESVDERLLDAAATLGASRARAFVTVVLPLAKGGVVAGATLGFARALGEFGVTLMIAGNIPDLTQTAALAIYDAVLQGKTDDALALSLALGLVGVCAVVVGERLGRSRG